MTFVIELVKSGKLHVVLGKHKYREIYTLKSGEVVWRRLGRNCKASIKTDAERTELISTNNTHSSPHPVTMRSMSSPQPMSTPNTRASTSKTDISTSTAEVNESTSSSSSTFSLQFPHDPGAEIMTTPAAETSITAAAFMQEISATPAMTSLAEQNYPI